MVRDMAKPLCAILLHIIKQLCTQGFENLSIFLAVTFFFNKIWTFFRNFNIVNIMRNISDITQNPGDL